MARGSRAARSTASPWRPARDRAGSRRSTPGARSCRSGSTLSEASEELVGALGKGRIFAGEKGNPRCWRVVGLDDVADAFQDQVFFRSPFIAGQTFKVRLQI